MTKIYLSDIIGFCNNVHKKEQENNISEINLTNKINTVIQNEKLNNNFKCNFIDILSLTKYYKTNELIFLSSLSFDFKEENKSWFYFLNSVLLTMYNDYIHKKKDSKKELIENLSELLLDKLNEDIITKKQNKNKNKTKFNKKNFNEDKNNFYLITSKALKVVLIIVENTCFNIYENILENQTDKKFLIFYKHEDYYFPFIEIWNTKYYNSDSFFVKELIFKKEKQKETISKNNNSDDIIQKISEHSLNKQKNKINTIEHEDESEEEFEYSDESDIENINNETEEFCGSNIKVDMFSEVKDNEYKEYISNHKNTLFMSEATNLKKSSKNKIEKQKNKVDILDTNIEKTSINTTIHKKSIELTKEDKQKIIDSTKKSMKLELLQNNASNLGIIIVEKDKKTGKIKNKKKNDLYDEIKNLKF